ncbi:MAG: UMP kinase [Nitrososphaerota archaeon]|nr:UMP kinase [Nitrososphaerota archaeon]
MTSTTSGKKIVLRIGGSVLGSPPKAKLLKGYAEAVSEARKQGHSVGVVVGGGPVARSYIGTAKELGLPRESQDMIAIEASRLNAKLVAMEFGVKRVSTTIQGMTLELRENGTGVMGGLRPGITTDTVAAVLGDAWKADLIIKASDQDGVYTADPREDREAKLLHNLSYQDFVRILGGGKHRPGIHSIVDPVAVKFIAKHRLRLVVTNGFFPSNVRKAMLGERVGTLVS